MGKSKRKQEGKMWEGKKRSCRKKNGERREDVEEKKR